jgi:hypothetical protein
VKRNFLLANLLIVSLLLMSAEGEPGPIWTLLSDDAGIRLWKGAAQGNRVVFRAETELDAGYRKVFSILRNQDRKEDWMAWCVENRLLRATAPGEGIVYHRIESPVPFIADRDAVVALSVITDADTRVLKIEGMEVNDILMPPKDGVVRMPYLRVSWILHAMTRQRSKLVYTVEADVGGSLPSWLVERVLRVIPRDTLNGLRSQLSRPVYGEDERFVDAAFGWQAFEKGLEAP